jgi:hypothetical protein
LRPHAAAELAGLLTFSDGVSVAACGQGRGFFSNDSLALLEQLATCVRVSGPHRNGRLPLTFALDPRLLARSGLLDRHGKIVKGLPHRLMMGDVEAVAAAARAAVIAAQPSSSSRGWLLGCGSSVRALALVGLLRRLGATSLAVERSNKVAVFIPGGSEAALQSAGIRLPQRKAVSRRPTTADVTALTRVNAGRRTSQRERTRDALEALGADCPEQLRAVAEMRLRFPDESLEELGLRFDPPLSRHAVCGRLRRLASASAEFS